MIARNRKHRHSTRKPHFENLEARQLLAVVLADAPLPSAASTGFAPVTESLPQAADSFLVGDNVLSAVGGASGAATRWTVMTISIAAT